MKSKNKKIKPDRKRISMIEIRGISGLLKFAFVVICAAAGFGVFPGVALMFIWNTFLAANTSVPSIGLFQGLLLYAICVVIFLISKGTRFSLSCSFNDLSDEELEMLITKAKMDAERRVRLTGVELCKAKLEEIEAASKKEEETELKEKQKEEV